ncbi:hypothetical protein ACNOYE_11765 [Nannocystaceae bacterium ST9]
MSYWYCLDTAGKPERAALREILRAEQGFTDSFQAVNTALKRRVGRPANRNLLTVITLGSSPAEVHAFLADKELLSDSEDSIAKVTFEGEHLGVWFAFEGWAEPFARGGDADLSRRAKMLQSEFSLRWVALDFRATWHLLQPTMGSLLGDRLANVISFSPSVADPKSRSAHERVCAVLDGDLRGRPAPGEFEQEFRSLRRDRSTLYEPRLASRFARYGTAVPGYAKLKPDHIAHDYTICAITGAKSDEDAAISAALKRTGHFLEFTSFLGADLEGIDAYLATKIDAYARMLEAL